MFETGSDLVSSRGYPLFDPVAKLRQSQQPADILRADGQGRLVFPKDHLFKSPSGAAIALIGGTANGWREWKSAQGQSLHQLVREGRTDEQQP